MAVSRYQRQLVAVHGIGPRHGRIGRNESLDQVGGRAEKPIVPIRPTRWRFQSKHNVYLFASEKMAKLCKRLPSDLSSNPQARRTARYDSTD